LGEHKWKTKHWKIVVRERYKIQAQE
jgi:hypothetical protein